MKRAARLTLAEQENPENSRELYWVHPMIRDAEWQKLSPAEQKESHEKAAQWYDREIEKQEDKPFGWLTECVWHELQAGKIRSACKHAVDLGNMMEKMQLYRERVQMQQEVADAVTEEVIAEAMREKDGNVSVLLSDLGAACHAMGDSPNLIRWTEKALETDKGMYGENHPDVATDYNNLGGAYDSLGQYDRAIAYYERALDIDRKNFGENHPSVAREYNNLGMAYFKLGEYPKAVEHIERTLAIFMQFLGPDHPNTKTVQNNLNIAKKAMLSEP